jgi:hypothetical protein
MAHGLKWWFLLLSSLLTAECVCTPLTFAQQPGSGDTCSMEITNPKEGEGVGADGEVSGKAIIPPGKSLWVFVHRKGLQGWWPQGGGPAGLDQGNWQVSVTYGLLRDIGRDFEVVALAVESEANTTLKAWFERADRTGTYSPMDLPTTSANCSIARVTVRKNE